MIKILRDPGPIAPTAMHSRLIARLEANSANLCDALNIAQAALERRKGMLTQWQNDLVDLDRMLADIKTLMGSRDLTRYGITAETPDKWLTDLTQVIIENKFNTSDAAVKVRLQIVFIIYPV